MIRWEKRGFIYGPKEEAPWMKSHAQMPAALVKEDRIRVYITVRPEQKISRVTFVDVDIKDPTKILYVHKEPILPLGKPGTFDEFGIMPTAVLEKDGEIWLYTTGWQRGQTVSYINGVGLAVSKDGGTTFEKPYDGPLLTITRHEPYSAMSPSVIRRGDKWQMWYGSGTGWTLEDGQYEPMYAIYYAHSTNGLDWVRPNICCIPGRTQEEAIATPSVIFENGTYHMWFSYRGAHDYRRGGKGSYRIGYASSADGMTWQRDDSKAGITVSESGWDSQMIAYPYVVDTPHGRYMFYNGNDFGRGGFGFAVASGRL